MNVRKLIPNLLEKSVVIFDNVSYHCIGVVKPPSKYKVKADMISRFWRQEIAYDASMRKHSLYNLKELNRSKVKTYRKDQILNTSYHVTLRFPHYNFDLSPTELARAVMKCSIRGNNVGAESSLDQLRNMTNAGIFPVNKDDCFGAHPASNPMGTWGTFSAC
jgi:hypothetical protein